MKTKRKGGGNQDIYLELVQRVPLRPIRSDDELDRAIEIVDELIDHDERGADERDYLDVLSDLIERYEAEAHPIAAAPDALVLAHLIEAKGVSQADVAREAGIAESTISEVLVGKRNLNRAHIGRLARYFNVGPAAFQFTE
ncbi:MAG TPA: transcriptional regulator [Planctomycetales bacterium]|jgi:HTH-type transcriptional regulator/antitoxin HigA|nr:transcriptional regulator [Planctomycetales bacterium]